MAEQAGSERVPDGPTEVRGTSWWDALKRTVREFREDNVTDWAAALTYYAVLSLFPALLLIVSLLGLVGQSAIQPLIDNVAKFAPGAAQDLLSSALQNLQRSRGAAGILFFVSAAGALWSASAYIGAFIRAANAIWDVDEGRPVWKTIPLRLGITILMVVLLAVSALAVVLTGPLARAAGQVIGLGDTAVTVWDIAKWPVLVLIVSFMFAVLYYAAPNVRHPGFRWISPGGILAVLLWIAASAAFAFYVANFGSYNETYGSIASIIIFLVWLWISNLALLLGAELNAELERGRQIAAGHPADEEPYLPTRS